MTAMAVPKFSTKAIDYPGWKSDFIEIVVSQHDDAAAVMRLKLEALPDWLAKEVIKRGATLEDVWTAMDKKYLDPYRMWQGVKAELKALDRKKLGDSKYIQQLNRTLEESDRILTDVGMAQWLRQEDKIPEYENLLTKSEKLEWVRAKPKLTGTPWEVFKKFLEQLSKEYEAMSKVGTDGLEEDGDEPREDKKKKSCTYCKKKGHEEAECFKKRDDGKAATEADKKKNTKACFNCGEDGHIARNCTKEKKPGGGAGGGAGGGGGGRNQKSQKNSSNQHDTFSGYLRPRDCRWCGRTYNNDFSCAGCGVKWKGGAKSEHCLAHCEKYGAASAKERGEMVLKGKNCLICLHHEHATESCFGNGQEKTICGVNGCEKRHHVTLHSAPQPTVQAVKMTGVEVHNGVESGDNSKDSDDDKVEQAASSTSATKFLARTASQNVNFGRAKSWGDAIKCGMDEARAKELKEMEEALKKPLVDGDRVLLLIHQIPVIYGPRREMTQLITFWDTGSTCSLIQDSVAEALGCPGEAVKITITTINGPVVRDTKLYAVELLNCYGDRVVVKAFGVEKVSEVRNVVDLSQVKHHFNQEIQDQWGKISKRPQGEVHLLVGQEMAPFHPIAYGTHGDLLVCRSMFGTGWLITGTDESIEPEHKCWGEEVAAMRLGKINPVHTSALVVSKQGALGVEPGIKVQAESGAYMCQAESSAYMRQAESGAYVTKAEWGVFSFTQDRDYYTLEGLGVEPARRCQNCKGCKDCSWRGQQLGKDEAFEFAYMEKCVKFENGRFHIVYPYLVDPAVLPNNYRQVVRIAEREEVLLQRDGLMDTFNDLVMELWDSGYLEELSEAEEKSWDGPIHYVSLQHVVNEDSATTKLRIVTNSSLKTPGNPYTLNGILAKGPNMLSNPWMILIRYRMYLKSLNSDITKAYFALLTGLVEKHVRRVVWRFGKKEARWKIFCYLCVSFGDRPAATLLEICVRMVVDMFKNVDLVAAHRLLNDRFVDDITTGGDHDEVERFRGEVDSSTGRSNGTMATIFREAGLELKAISVSGDPDSGAIKKLGGSVLGLAYSTEEDELAVKLVVNVSERRRGIPTGPDVTKDTLHILYNAVLNMRKTLGTTNGQYDVLGLIAPLLTPMKVAMRDLFTPEKNLQWDTPITGDTREHWVEMMEDLVIAGDIKFQRRIRPEGEVTQFWVVAFFDGSDDAFAGCLYFRWETTSGQVVVKLACAKSRVTPLRGISTPRSEVNGSVLTQRLNWNVVQALEETPPNKILIGGDSETVLAAREKACGALGEYFGNRIGEGWDLQEKIATIAPIGMEGMGEWYHMPSKDNAADRPSRADSKVKDVVAGTEWQEGMAYMYQDFNNWPWERNFAKKKLSETVPKEELAAKFKQISSKVDHAKHSDEISKRFQEGYWTNDYEKLTRRTSFYFKWLVIARRKLGEVKMDELDMAKFYWFKRAGKSTWIAKDAGKLKDLTIEDLDGVPIIRGRAAEAMKKLYGASYLPVIMAGERLAELIAMWAHNLEHKGVDISMHHARKLCWIVGGRKLMKRICKSCVRCRFLLKIYLTQKMAPLPLAICLPCPPWTNIALDLAGPYLVQSMLKKRGTRRGSGKMKIWAVIFVCLNTRAVKIEVAPGYSTEDFMVAWRCYTSEVGQPTRVHSDPGTQLTKAAKEVNEDETNYDWDEIVARVGPKVQWTFSPPGAAFRNGSAEAFVKKLKNSLKLYATTSLDYAGIQASFKEIQATLNTRPIYARYGPKGVEGQPDFLELITPSMLLHGKSGVDLPYMEREDEDDNPVKRLAHKKQVEEAWWYQWQIQCFESLLPTKGWINPKRGVKVGDVVLISYPSKAKMGMWRVGIVEKVFVDEDELIRTCIVSYRLVRRDLPEKSIRLYMGIKYKEVKVPVQRLIMLLPVEEQEQTRMLTDDELYKVDQDYGIKDAAAVGDIENYRGYSRDELLEARREAVAREKAKKQKNTVAALNSVIEEHAVDLSTGGTEEEHAVDLSTGGTEAGNKTSNVVYETVEELLQQHETQLNDVFHVEARSKLISNYKASLIKQRQARINNPTIVARLNHVRDFEEMWARLFKESA